AGRAVFGNGAHATAIGCVIQPAYRAYAGVAAIAIPVAQASLVFLAAGALASPDIDGYGAGATSIGQRAGRPAYGAYAVIAAGANRIVQACIIFLAGAAQVGNGTHATAVGCF